MNFEVDVYSALESLLLQSSGDVNDEIIATRDNNTTLNTNVSMDGHVRVSIAVKFREELTTAQKKRKNMYVVVKYRNFESKRLALDRLGFMVNDTESVCIPIPANSDDELKLVFEVWSDEERLLGIGQTSTRLEKETIVKIRNPLDEKDATVAILAFVVL